jgi:hypothetical protein
VPTPSPKPGPQPGPAPPTRPPRTDLPVRKDPPIRPLPAVPTQTGGWDAFSAADQVFLDGLWNRRSELKTAGAVSDAYKDSEIKRDTTSERDRQEYLAALKDKRPDLHKQTLVRPTPPGTYHTTPGASGVAWRVYVNAAAVHAPAVFAFVEDVVGKIDGILASKLGGYELVASSRDTIVIYAGSRRAALEAVGKLGEYRERNRQHFVAEFVGLTEPTTVPGVSLGQDPPGPEDWATLAEAYQRSPAGRSKLQGRYTSDAVLNKVFGFSFSGLRANLVYAAMRDAVGRTSGEQQASFRRNVVRYFGLAGINAAQPASQGTPKPEVVEPLIDLFFPKED